MARNRIVKWTDEQIISAVRDSKSLSDVRRALGGGEGGTAWRNMKKQIELLNLDTSHFSTKRGPRTSIQDRFIVYEEIPPNMSTIRKHYLSLREYSCDGCGLADWLGGPIRLHMDHIDGDRKNNLLNNLRLLCPNCHDQTETWGRSSGLGSVPSYCACGAKKGKNSSRCRACDLSRPNRNPTKIVWPSLPDIESGVKSLGFSGYARTLGVSDNAVRKHLRKSGIS